MTIELIRTIIDNYGDDKDDDFEINKSNVDHTTYCF